MIYWVTRAVLLIMFLHPGVVFSQLIEEKENGKIDWGKRIITATGFGIPNKSLDRSAWKISARKAARLGALAELLAITQGMTVNSNETVADFVLSHQIEGKVEGIIKNFKVVDTRYNPDGSVEVDVSIPIDGALSDLFISAELEKKSRLVTPEKKPAEAEPQPPEVTQEPTEQPQEPEAEKILYTGMVVDAKGLRITPCPLPKIVDEDGNEVYSLHYTSEVSAKTRGVVDYKQDLEKARVSERVKDNPLIIKGISVSGPNKADVVISNDDVEKLYSLASNFKFMEECRVIIVVD